MSTDLDGTCNSMLSSWIIDKGGSHEQVVGGWSSGWMSHGLVSLGGCLTVSYLWVDVSRSRISGLMSHGLESLGGCLVSLGGCLMVSYLLVDVLYRWVDVSYL